jgi:hypothetical protein
MKRAIQKILGALAVAVSLAATAPADAEKGGWLFPQPNASWPQYVWWVTDTNGSQWVTFHAGLDWWGSWVDPIGNSGTYDNWMEVYCTDQGWWANDFNFGVTGNAGDITLACDTNNFHYGAAAFYYVDT